jgi:hypothetical protein
MDDLTASDAQDKVRAYRMFTGLASTFLGIEPDQNYASEDAAIGSPVGVHAVADPYRGAAVQGKTTAFGSTTSGGGLVLSPGLLLLALGAFFLLKKG